MAAYYEKLLRLCGFNDEDLAHDGPRLEKTFDKIKLDAKDMEVAEERIRKYHDIELIGVQKLIRAWLLELADLVLARDEGKKIIYYGYPSIQGPGMAIKMAGGDELYVGCPDVVLCHTVGNFFGKLAPIVKAAEENGLPSGYALCSLQQMRNGGMALGIVPVPDLVTGSSYYCDMGSKADELLHQRYGHKAVYVDGSMDSRWGEYPDYLPERVEFLGAQLNKMFATVKKVVGVEATIESQDKAMAVTRRLFSALAQLTMLMQADPMPISAVEQELALNLAAASTGRAISEGPDAVETLNLEVKQRVEKGFGMVPKGAPRVLNFADSFSDPDITHMIEQSGLAASLSIVTVPTPKEFITESKKYETMGEQRAQRGMIDGFYHSSFGIVRRVEEAVKTLKADGVIWNYQYNCRPLSITSHIVEKWVEEQTGVPVLSLESDIYDGSSYSAASLRIRVEAFAELLKSRKLN
jgi:benzoyl-CoA reductase/2-hydroxyglutaryl-CoA dehydratase subunit BcrC/BadD/HgdB